MKVSFGGKMQVKCNELFAKIAELYPKYIDVWTRLCSIESPTDCKEGIDEASAYLASVAAEFGCSIERYPQAVAGDVVTLTLNPDASLAPFIFSGHLDTVHPVGLFGTPPVRRDDTYIYGPGVVDCKGGVVAALCAMEALASVGFRRRPVKLVLQTDEEGGSARSGGDTIRYIMESAKGAVAFLNLEGHNPGWACLLRKGIATFTFTVRGVAAHAASCATDGASAICEAAHKIIRLEKFKDENGLTCNCGVIEGGTTPNTVPAFCRFRANVRFATQEQLAYIRRFVKELAAESTVKGTLTTVEETGGRPAMEFAKRNEDLLCRLNEIYEENGLPVLLAADRRLGGSDAAYITLAGVPCIDSLGVEGKHIHSKEEKALLLSLLSAAKRLSAAAYEI